MPRSLRPGLTVVRRDDGHLQVGVDPPLRVVLPDRPGVRRVLDALAAGTGPDAAAEPEAAPVLAALEAAGALVAQRPHGLPGATPPAVEAAWAAHGDDAPRRLAARREARVSWDAPATVAAQLRDLTGGAGLAPAEEGLGDVHLVVGHGEVARDRVDGCMRTATPHLVVAGRAGGYAVGPFVVPGVSPCLRCDDAQHGETDPRRAIVVEQAARAPARPGDPVTFALALAWAVRDVVTWVEGDRPTTWGAVHALAVTGPPTARPVRRHPHCGCGWAQLLPAADG